MKLVLQIFELKVQTMKTASVARECKDDLGLCRHECTKCGLSFTFKSCLQVPAIRMLLL